ncbi:MAG: phage holin family protein [Candidatus Brachytrichaceae bacterium NZ_4S206]|jgi:putative membrane protein
MGQIIGFIFGVIIAAVVLLIVSRLNLGLSVAGFSTAVIGAVVISLVSSVILWLLGLFGVQVGGGSLLNVLVWLVVSAVILIVAAKFIPGMTVQGFTGGVIAAIAMAVIYWLFSLILGPLVSPLPAP